MNKTVNINLAGHFFHIDENAYLKLKGYLEAIKRSFTDSEGRLEIIADIEARIVELFNERIKHERQVVSLKEVEEVIAIMGQPEDYLVDDDLFEDNPKYTYSKTTFTQKKLFRDIENSYISGVSSGVAHYLGIAPILMRLLWVVLAFISLGTFIVVYILLWILIPAAMTTADKIMMKGDPVNIDNIEKKIKDGFDNVSGTVAGVAKNVSDSVSSSAKKHSVTMKSTSKFFFDGIAKVFLAIGSVLTKIIGFVFILFSSVVLIGLVLGFFSIVVKNILNIPGVEFLHVMNAANTPIWFGASLIFFAIGIPFFFFFYIGLKIFVNNLKTLGVIVKLTLLGVWLFSVIGLIVVVIREASEHSFSEKVIEKKILDIKANDTLYIKMNNEGFYSGARGIVRNNQFKLVKNNEGNEFINIKDVEVVIKSTSDSNASLVIEKYADGIVYEEAIKRALNIIYSESFSKNNLNLDSFLSTAVQHKYSGQEVIVFVYVPKSIIVKLDNNLQYYNSYSSIIKRKHLNHYLSIKSDEVECLDCEKEEGYEVDVQTPKMKINEDGVEINSDDGSLKIDKDGVRLESKKLKVSINNDGINILQKNKDEVSLRHVAYTDKDSFVRLAALKMLTNQSDIRHVAYTDEDNKVRSAALKMLTNQSDIRHIAYTDIDKNIRAEALELLEK